MSLRIRAAIFDSTDPGARSTRLISASVDTVQANTPKGGCWRPAPAGARRNADVPRLASSPPRP